MKNHLQINDSLSQKLYQLMNATENKSALDYYYWNNKLLYLTTNRLYSGDFERNFQNAVVLSGNNSDIKLVCKYRCNINTALIDPPKELVKTIKSIGPERCIISTDFGQDFHPMPAEGLRMGIATMLKAGLEEVEIGMLVKDNPCRLLGL